MGTAFRIRGDRGQRLIRRVYAQAGAVVGDRHDEGIRSVYDVAHDAARDALQRGLGEWTLALEDARAGDRPVDRSEEHTSELQSLMRISYAVFCLKKKKEKTVYSI